MKFTKEEEDTSDARVTCAIDTVAADLAVTGLTREIWRYKEECEWCQ
jgi:hypothetical protein